MRRFILSLVLPAFFGLTMVSIETSAMTGPPAKSDVSLKDAMTAIDAKNFPKAVEELQMALTKEKENADLWNLLGFSYRQMAKFDLAWDAYERALTINPDHRGANEYLGELYLQQGQLDLAKQQLTKLAQICPFGCRERNALKEKIDDATSS